MSSIVSSNQGDDRVVAAVPTPSYVNDDEVEGRPNGLTIADYVASLWRHKWLVLICVTLGLGLAILSVARAPDLYTARAVVRLGDTRLRLGGIADMSPYNDVMGRETDILLSQIQVMLSRTSIAEVVAREGLRLAPLDGQRPLEVIRAVAVDSAAAEDTVRFRFGPEQFSVTYAQATVVSAYGDTAHAPGLSVVVARAPEDSTALYSVVSRSEAISGVLGSLSAEPRQRTDIVDLDFVASDPGYAQRVVNSVALTFQDMNANRARQTSRRRRIFLEEQLGQIDSLLKKSLAEFAAYRSRERVFSSSARGVAQEESLVQLGMRRADLNAQRAAYKALLAQAQASPDGLEAGLRALVSSPGSALNPAIQSQYLQLRVFEARRDSMLMTGAASSNPDLIRTRSQLSASSERLLDAVRGQIQSLDAQIASLDEMRLSTSAEMAGTPVTQTEEGRLGERVKAIQELADNLQEQYQGARMAETVESGQVEIVDLAEVPDEPISQGRTSKLALGLLLGLFGGTGIAVLLDGANRSIRRRDDLERVLLVPGLAVIPSFLPGRARRLLAGVSGNGKSPRAADAPDLVTVADMNSIGAEAFRTLRTNLIFSQAVQTLRSIVVTSAAPGEGKTTTAANVAVTFAQQGLRVLLIDCDLRRARVHNVFDIPKAPGFTDCVLGIAEPDQVVRATAVQGLYVLAAGKLPPNPAELLGGARARDTLLSLQEAYDLVLLDTPPVLAASDAAILATLTDGVIVVVRAGVTEIEAGRQAMKQLAAVGARVVGAVLNDPDSKVEKYGGHYAYDYAAK